MSAFRRVLSLADREEISRGVAAEEDFKVIAKRIGRDASVVSREVARHGGRCGYRAGLAQARALRSRSRPKALAVDRDEKLRAHVQSRLRQGWSPGSIAGDLKRYPIGGRVSRVCAEAIYQWVYAQPVSTLDRELIKLRSGRVKRRGGPKPLPAPRITEPTYIDQRPLFLIFKS